VLTAHDESSVGVSVWHALPERMVGPTLHPLNELRGHDPGAYERARAKYGGREQVLTMRVPLLDCLWNDVLHLSPVHPRELVEALTSVGLAPDRRRFLAIDAAELDPTLTVLFLNSTGRECRFDPDQWEWLDVSSLERHARLPEATREYYRACARDGTRPRLFAHIPHVLFRGSLDLSRLAVIDV
jgi:hypothetical protein